MPPQGRKAGTGTRRAARRQRKPPVFTLKPTLGEEEEPEEEEIADSAADRQKKAAMLEMAKRSGQQWSVRRTKPAQTQRAKSGQLAPIAEGGKKRKQRGRRTRRRGKGPKSRTRSKTGSKRGQHRSRRGARGIQVIPVAQMPPAMSPCQMRALRGMLISAGPGW